MPITHDMFNELKRHYNKDEVLEAVRNASEHTAHWLRMNHQRYTSEGSLEQVPWWTEPPSTSNPVLTEERLMTFRARAFEHGLFEMYSYLLHEKRHPLDHKYLPASPEKKWSSVIVPCVTDPWTSNVVRELVKRQVAFEEGVSEYTDGSPSSVLNTVSLKVLHSLYGYSPSTNPTKVRDRIADDLAPLGLLEVFVNRQYDIRVGVVAFEFYRAYFRMIQTHGVFTS